VIRSIALALTGLAWTLPPGWHALETRPTAVVEPAHVLTAASFPLRQTLQDRSCEPETARRQLPRDGAVVFLIEYRDGTPKLPQRPKPFRLGRPGPLECFGHGTTVAWTEQGRALQAIVMLGDRARAAKRQAEALLDSLDVQPVPPPPPPAGWRFVVSGAYDSMRVPPGWSAQALKRPKRTPRPRRLFRIANRDRSVVVRVVEHRRGRPSPKFPPARAPLVFDVNRRAGMSFRGYRFAIRLVARPGAGARDLELAEISARSLGVSGVGRG
jgi:hypothetical protein